MILTKNAFSLPVDHFPIWSHCTWHLALILGDVPLTLSPASSEALGSHIQWHSSIEDSAAERASSYHLGYGSPHGGSVGTRRNLPWPWGSLWHRRNLPWGSLWHRSSSLLLGCCCMNEREHTLVSSKNSSMSCLLSSPSTLEALSRYLPSPEFRPNKAQARK